MATAPDYHRGLTTMDLALLFPITNGDELLRHCPSPYRDQHLSFETAGSLIELGYDPELMEAKPSTGIVIAFGRTKDGNRGAKS